MDADLDVTQDIPVVTDWPVPPSQISGALPIQRRPRPHRYLAMAGVSAVLMAVGLIFLTAPSQAPVRATAAAELPVYHAPENIAPTMPSDYGVPHPRIILASNLHQHHVNHEAYITSHKTPVTAVTIPINTTSPGTVPASSSASSPASTATPVAPSPTPTTSAPVTQAAGSGVGGELLAKAETMSGVPYVYGGATPAGFDCSGLVYWAAGQLGITLPRDTYGMLAGSPNLEVVSSPEPGDLAFFGSGHVELYVSPGEFFGAQQTGTLVGLHNYGAYYVPTTYLRLVA